MDLAVTRVFDGLVDVLNWRRLTFFFVVISMTSMVIYITEYFVDLEFTTEALFGGRLSFFSEPVQLVGSAVADGLVQWAIMYLLYRNKLFLRI